MSLSDRWRVQTAEDHTHHERNVSYRAMLQAVCPGAVLTSSPPSLTLGKMSLPSEIGRLRIGKSLQSFQQFARDAAAQLNSKSVSGCGL